MAADLGELQSKLWEAADQLRANSGLKASEYASPVLWVYETGELPEYHLHHRDTFIAWCP